MGGGFYKTPTDDEKMDMIKKLAVELTVLSQNGRTFRRFSTNILQNPQLVLSIRHAGTELTDRHGC